MSLQNVTFNLASSVRFDTMEGRDYIVAPMVMITEGVHNGSNGPLYYPRSELSKTPEVWNHKPVVVYHPTMNGLGVSACDPNVITNRKVGVIMNTYFDKKAGKLRAEAWLEKERIQEVDPRIAEALSSGEIMELSTGLFTDNELIDGEWNGKQYKYVARNYRPDHLALLPDKTGACSIEDGAGLLQLNERQKTSILQQLQDNFGDDVQIQNVVTSQIAFNCGSKLYQVDCFFDEGNFTIDSETCLEVTSNEFTDSRPNLGVDSMSHVNELVDAIIDNDSTTFNDDDRETLLGLSEDFLAKLQPVANDDSEEEAAEEVAEAEEAEEVAEEVASEELAEAEAEVEEAVVGNDELTVEEYVANAPSEIRDMLQAGLESHNRDRQALIDVVTGNEKNIFSDDVLQSKPISELKALAALASQEVVGNSSEDKPSPNYAGAVGAHAAPVANTSDEEAPLLIPTINWDE
jgi:hypothetical protein